MSIIKDAFTEGRETKKKWERSQARKNDVRLEVGIQNLKWMNKRTSQGIMRMQQIDPETGETLNIFPSRLAVAQYIVDNILKDKTRNPVSITGNIEMCMMGNWKAYGYYWKQLDEASYIKNATKTPSNVSNGKPVFIYGGKGVNQIFPSIAAASRGINISEDIIKRCLDGKSGRVNSYVIQPFNNKLKTIRFKNVAEAVEKTGFAHKTITRYTKLKLPINNILYKIDSLE